MRQIRYVLWLVTLFASLQNASAFVRYELPNQTSRDISRMIQDSKGFVWIGTDNGLNRFDGWTNVVYTHNREDSTSLKSNMVEALFTDSDGTLWIATGGGLQRYVEGTDKFRNVTFPTIPSLSVRSIIQRGKDELLVVTSGYGAFKIDKSTMKASGLGALNKIIGTPYAHVVRIDPLNRIWIGAADNRLIIVDKNLNPLHTAVFTERILDIASNKENDVYVATDYNIYRWDATRREFESLKGYPGWRITGLLTTSDGDILLHTLEAGVFRITRTSIEEEEKYGELKGEGILKMYEDRDGDVWIGTRKGGIIMDAGTPELFKFKEISTAPSVKVEAIFNRTFGSGVAIAMSDGRIIAYDSDLNPEAIFQSSGRVTSSTQLRDGTVLLGYSDGRIMKYTNGKTELADASNTRQIDAIAEDKRGRLYAALLGDGFVYRNNGSAPWEHITESTPMSTRTHLGNNWINVIMPDDKGQIWLGHYNGVDLYDPESNGFKENTIIRNLRAHIVYSILKAKDGTIWVGTNNGLYHLHPEKDMMEFYGAKEGLSGNRISGIEQANNGDIWCTTNNGISRIRYADNKAINYISGNGLGERDYRKGLLMRATGDKLFTVGINGITAFFPDAITDARPVSAPVLTRINLNNKDSAPEITYQDDGSNIAAILSVLYNQNTFSLEFSTFDYGNPGSVLFEYRIPQLDKEWRSNPFGDNRVICNYMEPGDYLLEVRAVENGLTSPTTSILIEIMPPWYLMGWAKTLYVLLFVVLSVGIWYAFHRYREQRQKEEISEEKIKMLYNFAHELRSPVTLITSPLTSLIEEEQDERKANTFRMIQRNGYRITNLVNQMLDVRRIEKGQMKLSFTETDLKEYIELIIEDFRPSAMSRRITLGFSAPDGEIKAYIDTDNFDKVMVNLISNALKFTPEGGSIEVTLKKKREADGHETAVIEVSDTGAGIPPHDLMHIFDRFYQADRKSKGFGIGLNLTKMLVDMHHGSIQAYNRTNGSGARFEIVLPLGRAHLKDKEINRQPANHTPKKFIEAEEALSTPSETGIRKATRQHRLLIVDDDDEIREYLKRELENTYKITTAANGEEAYAIAQEKQIDLIISDIMMPKTDGFELLRKIRSNADLSHIPIILLTTSEDFNTRMAGWEKGADGYLTKPFRIEELRQLCASLIFGRIRLKGRYSHGEKIEEHIEKIEVKGNDELLLERIIKAVNENLGDSEFGVERLAETVGLSRVHLHRKMKALVGLTPRDFLKSIRLKRAAELLKKKDTNISQVGYMVGFSSPGQFSESFKKYYGCSPSELRARETKETK